MPLAAKINMALREQNCQKIVSERVKFKKIYISDRPTLIFSACAGKHTYYYYGVFFYCCLNKYYLGDRLIVVLIFFLIRGPLVSPLININLVFNEERLMCVCHYVNSIVVELQKIITHKTVLQAFSLIVEFKLFYSFFLKCIGNFGLYI